MGIERRLSRAQKRTRIGVANCIYCDRVAGRKGRRSSPPPPKSEVKDAADKGRRRLDDAVIEEQA